MVFVFVFVMLFLIYVFPYTNEGPLWVSKVATEVENCKITFWDNFFAVSNIRNTNKMVIFCITPLTKHTNAREFAILFLQCLIVSWYISVDIQLTILGCILMLITVKSKVLGIVATIFTFTVAAIVTGVIAYANNYHALLPAYFRYSGNRP